MGYEMIKRDELYHHGVKGQKWGVINKDERLGRRSGHSINIPTGGRTGTGQSVSPSHRPGRPYSTPNSYSPKEHTTVNSKSEQRQARIKSYSKDAIQYSDRLAYPLILGNGGSVEIAIPNSTISNAGSWMQLGLSIFQEIDKTAKDNDLWLTKDQRNMIFRNIMWSIKDNEDKYPDIKNYSDTSDSWTSAGGAYSKSRRNSSLHGGRSMKDAVKHSYTVSYPGDELYHHGILGMKWGVRRYQNPDGSLTEAGMKRYGTKSRSTDSINSAEGIQRRLNDLDSGIVRNERHLQDSEGMRKYWTKKGNKLSNKMNVDLRDEMKQKEAYRKADKYDKEADTYKKNIEKGREEVAELMKRASENGFNVKTSLTTRSVAEGKDVAATILANASSVGIGLLIGAPIIPIFDGPRRFGTNYKVKDSGTVKTGESSSSSNNSGTYEQRRSSYLSENKSRLLKDAKEKGTFDMEFLESNGDTNKNGEPLKGKELMDAYERYIDDEIKRGQN